MNEKKKYSISPRLLVGGHEGLEKRLYGWIWEKEKTLGSVYRDPLDGKIGG